MNKNDQIETLYTLFKGLERAHGRYTIDLGESNGGKVAIQTTVVHAPVEKEAFGQHLRGTRGVQITPVNDEGKCYFGCVDVDEYDLPTRLLAMRIFDKGFPLVACRTKSNGSRLFLFVTEPVPASAMQKKLRHMAALLGVGSSEVFPKQIQLHKDKGDVGNRVILPYFGEHSEEKSSEHAFSGQGVSLDLEEFFEYVARKQLSPKQFEAISTTVEEVLPSGPPCLNLLLAKKIESGEGQSRAMFNIAIYAHKAYKEEWKTKLHELNKNHFVPPISENELGNIIKSVEKKNGAYMYQCREEPMCQFCNSALCRTRKYGIGSGYGIAMSGSLQKLDCDPPLWFLNFDDGSRIEFTSEQLLNQALFQKTVMEKINIVPQKVKPSEWHEVLSGWFETLEILPAPSEATPAGRLKNLLIDFCVGTVRGRRKEDMLLPRCKVYTKAGRHQFLLEAFFRFLEKRNYREMEKNKVLSTLKDFGATSRTERLGNTKKTVWSIEEFVEVYVEMTDAELNEKIVSEEDVF